jgi:hypothetical protein
MPIRINLLAETLAAEDLRRRDPVKRAIYVGAFFVALSLVWYSSTRLEFMVEKSSLSRVEDSIQMHTNDYAQVQSNLKKINEVQKKLDALDHLASKRFLQGNLLNGLQQVYVPNVQLVRMAVNQTYSSSPAVPAKTNSFGVVAGHPAGIVEHVVLSMDAKDFSSNPGDQVHHFEDAIVKQSYFNQHIDTTNGLRLSGLSALQTPGEGKPFVMFTVECRFLDKVP